TPNAEVLDRMIPLIRPYDCKVFHLESYVPANVDGKVEIVPPAIDPLSPKNMALSPEDAAFVCDQFGVDVDRPLLCQVSRFDPWKDPRQSRATSAGSRSRSPTASRGFSSIPPTRPPRTRSRSSTIPSSARSSGEPARSTFARTS